MEAIFKYIFALVVGVLFIIFFIGFAYNYIGTEDTKISLLLTKSFDDQLSILSVAQDSVMHYDFGTETELSFNRGAIRAGSQSSRKSDNIVYAPINLKGKELTIWTRKWELPYAVTNFFYMSNSNYKYVLIHDSSSEEFVKELVDDVVPEQFGVVTYDADTLKEQFAEVRQSYSGYSEVKFVYFSEDPSNSLVKALERIRNSNVVTIMPGNEDWEFGEVEFSAGKSSMFFTEPMLIGAIFVDDYSNYDFNLEKRVLPKLKEITEVYVGKADFMMSALQCQEYSLIKTQLNHMYELGMGSEPKEFIRTAESLEEINKDRFGAECPGVF